MHVQTLAGAELGATVHARAGVEGPGVSAAHLCRWFTLASVMRSQKVRSSVCSSGSSATEATPASVISRHKARFRLVS